MVKDSLRRIDMQEKEQRADGVAYLTPDATVLGAPPYYPDTTVQPGDPADTSYSWETSDAYPDRFILLLVGVEHDGTTCTTAGTKIYMRDYLGGTSPTPPSTVRPYYKRGESAVERWHNGFRTRMEEVGDLGFSLELDRLFKSIFHPWTSAEFGCNIQGVPAVGDTSITLENLPGTGFFEIDRFSNSAPSSSGTASFDGQWTVSWPTTSPVARLGGDYVRYKLGYSTNESGGEQTFTIEPPLQQSTFDAIDGGDDSVEWLPRFEIPKDTPFDVCLRVQKITRITRILATVTATEPDGYRVGAHVYYNYYEPRAWY
jgi:hypothetical protein